MPDAGPALGRLRPRLTLQTLTRGDGLLGMHGGGVFGPRGAPVTVVRVDWTYTTDAGLSWETPAPQAVLGKRPSAAEALVTLRGAWGERAEFKRDLRAEADARDRLAGLGLHPLPPDALQWRDSSAAIGHTHLWTLVLEDTFGDFWAERVPELQAEGWQVVARAGFAHESVPVEAWRLVVDHAGAPLGREPRAAGGEEPLPLHEPGFGKLALPERAGSWLVTLGVEVDGKPLDLAPLLADLLKRDRRWLDAKQIAEIPDDAVIKLRAPGGRRIDAPAAPLKAIVGAMVDLLTDPQQHEGPLQLGEWDVARLAALQEALSNSLAKRARADIETHGERAAWQLQGEAGLQTLATRLQAAGAPPAVPAPEGLGLALRPYQLQGLAWLQHLRAQGLAGILADDMGLGKTAQALAHVLTEKQAGRLDAPALVVVPTSLLFNWQAEAARIAPALRVLVLHGAKRKDDFARIAQHDLVLTSYPLLWRDLDMLAGRRFHLLVLDEAQTVKNAASRGARAVRRIPARHRLCLTGTPLENHLGELWTQFDFLMPGFLGAVRDFKRRFRDPIEKNGESVRAQLLAQRVRPFILRRRKADVATELPPKVETVERIRLEGRQRELYESVRVAADEMVRRALARSGFEGSQISILDALLKLRQVCCDPHLLKKGLVDTPEQPMERAKMEWLRDALPSLVEEGRRILVFSQFAEMLGLVEPELDALGLPWLALTGATPPEARGPLVARFQAGEVTILLVSLKAGGTGLNLTAADTVIHLDPWWNPAVERQATDRAHRIGQTQTVFVYKLVVEGSIEERILTLQSRKSVLADGVLGHDAEAAAKFGAEELEALLAPLDSAGD